MNWSAIPEKKGVITEVGMAVSVVTRLTRDDGGEKLPYYICIISLHLSLYYYRNLLLDNIYCTGTLQVNRCNFPPVLRKVGKTGLAKEVIER